MASLSQHDVQSRQSTTRVGLDLRTSTVVSARKNGRGVHAHAELKAFIELPTSRSREQILHQNEIDFVRERVK